MKKIVLIALMSALPATVLAQEAMVTEADSSPVTSRKIELATKSFLYIVTDEKNGTVCYVITGSLGWPVDLFCFKK